MERAVAIKKLSKLLGKKFAYQISKDAPGKEQREAAQAQCRIAVKERDTLREKLAARQKQILDADAEYQALLVACKTAREATDKLGWTSRHYKITVGTDEGLFFHVEAEGDSWEEVIAKLEKKKVPA